MYDSIDVPDLRREVERRADTLQRDADRSRLRAEGRRRGRLTSAFRRTVAAADGSRRAV
jgi:hypothetical protein